MDDKIVVTFCLCDDLLKAIQHPEDHQCHMNDAEIMTTALVASLFLAFPNVNFSENWPCLPLGTP